MLLTIFETIVVQKAVENFNWYRRFDKNAYTDKEFAERSSKRVILINGSQLARYMIDHNVGVSTVETYEIKRVDSDYFAEDAESS